MSIKKTPDNEGAPKRQRFTACGRAGNRRRDEAAARLDRPQYVPKELDETKFHENRKTQRRDLDSGWLEG